VAVTVLTARTERKRSLASAFTYRVTSTILLAVISYFVTGQWLESLFVTVTFAFFATVLYYFNDRAWERTDWGRKDFASKWTGAVGIEHEAEETG
jgi:uncharacterized membrane protein